MGRSLLAGLLLGFPLLATEVRAESPCTKTEIQRAAPGGEEFPALLVECDEAPTAGLLARDAVDRVCAADLPPAQRAACEEAVARAQAALRKVRIRAALRRGVADEQILQDFDASGAELDRLREAAERTAPLPDAEAAGEAP